MNVRCLIPGETLPVELQTGFEKAPGSDHNWIFIAERDEKPVGILVTAPAHLFVIFVRLVMADEAEAMDLRNLLVGVARICRERNFEGYVTWLDPTRPEENSLIGIIRAHGGQQLTNAQVVCAGRM